MLKVAYISPIYFANVDISFIHEMRNYCDIHYFPIARPEFKGCAIECPKLEKSGIYKAINIPEMAVLKELIDLDKTKIVVRYERSSRDLSNFKITHQLAKLLKKEHFDVIHFTESLRANEMELLRFRHKSVMSVHDPFSHSYMRSKVVEAYRRLMFKSLSHFIVFNSVQTQDFINFYKLQKKQVFESTLSVYSYLRIYESHQKSRDKYILFIGRIWSHKGLDYLFPAMKLVHRKHPNFKLIIAGGGMYYFDISEYYTYDYFDIRNRYIDDAEQASLIANAECVVCPYIDATQSGVVMSAYAFDKPCIVTNVGGLPDMVGNGEYGLIVPPKNVQALADAICQIIEYPEMQQQFSQKIHTTYTNGQKSWKYIAKNVFDNVYMQIANK